MAKKKYYAVKSGRKTGIFESWSECEEQIKGYSGALFEGFSDIASAKAYIGEACSCETDQSIELPKEKELYAYVDGSYNIKTKVFGYGVVLIHSDGTTKELLGSGDSESAASMRNVAGELKGAFTAMQYAVNNRYASLTVFHDYEGVAKWAEHKWKTNLPETRAYAEFCDKIRKALNLSFVKVDAHTGVLYNERADVLAKTAVGIIGKEEKK